MKIGLLAMSGIRVCDEKLLRLGLTMPGFVDRSKVIASLPSLGLLCLAACTPAEHEVNYFEAQSDGSEPKAVYDCDLVAISTFSAQIFEAYAIADRLRAAGVKVAMGGLHVSVLPDEAAAHADYVVTGEGERSWPAVILAAQEGRNPKVFRGEDFPPVKIDELPVPRYDLLGQRPYNRFTVQSSRGCPWRCDFCASTVMLGEKYRKRPIDRIVRDIHAICRVRQRPFIEFADDNTFVDKQWGKELCRNLIPLRLKWFTETDITVADDPELLDLMRRAGCRQVLIGLESPDRSALEGIELRGNLKAIWSDRYADAIRAVQSHGITVNGCFVLGLDGHTPDIFHQVRDFAMEQKLYDVQITILTAFPGTPLYDRLKRQGRILQDRRWDLCTLFDVNYQPLHMTPQDLRDGMYWLGQELYSDEATKRRRDGFFHLAQHGRSHL
ncbi:MAG: radical SAM protein [Tepidisphaeraceae bacterium]|jgi:radical SAM superfamily enzyme YgiQ (UPF0313 family)